MKAMILAAGLATRLRPLTNEQPKALLPVGDHPIIHYTLLLLKRFGITEVVINLHHRGQQIMEALGNGATMGMRIHYSHEPTILGTGGGIKHARYLLGEGTFLVINGDILVDLNLDKVVEFHHRRKATVSMVVRTDPEAARYGAIEVDAHDRIWKILGRGSSVSSPIRQFMFTGVHILEPRVFDWIPGNGFSSITDIYVNMLKQDEKLFAYVAKGAWLDLGTPERYEEANRLARAGQLRLGYLKHQQQNAVPRDVSVPAIGRRPSRSASKKPAAKTPRSPAAGAISRRSARTKTRRPGA